jgi:hypothetical protein
MSENENLLLYIFVTTCSLSVIMSSMLSILYFKYGSLKKNFPAQLIITMSLLEILIWSPRIISSIYKLQTGDNMEVGQKEVCVIFGFTFIFFNMINFFITLVISFGIYSSVLHNIIIAKHKKICIGIIILFPLLFSLIPFITESYGQIDDIKCSITNYPERLACFFVILWIIFILNAFFIISTIIRLKKRPYNKAFHRIVYKIALFPLFMFIAWAPSSIYRILELDNLILGVLTYLLVPLQGFFNPIAYGLINEKIEKKIKKFIGCCSNEEDKQKSFDYSETRVDSENFIN